MHQPRDARDNHVHRCNPPQSARSSAYDYVRKYKADGSGGDGDSNLSKEERELRIARVAVEGLTWAALDGIFLLLQPVLVRVIPVGRINRWLASLREQESSQLQHGLRQRLVLQAVGFWISRSLP